MNFGSCKRRAIGRMTNQSDTIAVTSGPREGIARRTVIGAGWMILWRMATRVLGVLSTFVLARVLVPADFGLIAIATTFIGIFDAFSVFGLQDALIREGRPDRDLYDTAFTIGVIRGIANTGLVVAGASLAAEFFGDPRLAAVVLVLAILALCDGFENIAIVDFVATCSSTRSSGYF